METAVEQLDWDERSQIEQDASVIEEAVVEDTFREKELVEDIEAIIKIISVLFINNTTLFLLQKIIALIGKLWYSIGIILVLLHKQEIEVIYREI